jgi:hypothetical protein
MTDEVLTQEQIDEQEAADFKAAFSGESVTQSEDTDLPQPEPEPEPEPQNLTQADIDRIRMEAAAEAEQKHIKRIRDLSGEVGGLRQKLESMATAQAAAQDAGAAAPSTQQIKEASTSGAKLAALKEDFPEFAEALEEVLSTHTQPDLSEWERKLQAAEEDRKSTADKLETLAEMRRLDKAHPDWEEVVSQTPYHEWLQTQSEQIRHVALNSKNAEDAIKILSWYKASDQYKSLTSSAPTAPSGRQNSRLESALTPTSGAQVTRKQPKTEHEEFLEAFGRR